jgi:hypothetical protein
MELCLDWKNHFNIRVNIGVHLNGPIHHHLMTRHFNDRSSCFFEALVRVRVNTEFISAGKAISRRPTERIRQKSGLHLLTGPGCLSRHSKTSKDRRKYGSAWISACKGEHHCSTTTWINEI